MSNREYDQLAELKSLWQKRGSERSPQNIATADPLCCLCLALARKQEVDFPVLATNALPDANGVERWLCSSHWEMALKKRQERLNG